MWTKETIHKAVEKQRRFFRTGATYDVDWRIRQLKRLKNALIRHEKSLTEALSLDLGRHETEAYFCDVGSVILEINETIRGLKKWARPERHFSGLLNFPSFKTSVFKMPYGVTLIISPFNFPVMLSIGVLTAAVAGGNTAVIKMSSKAPNCAAAINEMLSEIFPSYYATVIDGGHDIADLCLEERFDKIFYTGSPRVGVHVMEMAAKHLTPVALELGGETGNWCIVRRDADIKDAARKIAFFKMCNSGQICININQIAVSDEIADAFIKELKNAFLSRIGPEPLNNAEYPHLISKAAYERCEKESELYRDRIVFGGHGDPGTLKYEPTVIYPVSIDEPVVCHELFNPLLPVVPFKDDEVETLLDVIAEREHGLALYLFTKDKKWADKVMSTQQYGGGCVNEVCQHIMVRGVPFNGTGHSGMGAYHGEWGFKEFTHPSSVMYGSTHFNLPLREHPYGGKGGDLKMKLIRFFER